VHAVIATRSQSAVVAGISAALLAGLPLIGPVPSEVYLLASGKSGRRRNSVVELPRSGAESIETHDGIARTSLADSVIEVSRTAPFLTALAMVDAALKVDRYGNIPPLLTIETLWLAFEQRMPFRGSRRARAVLEFASRCADSPLETLSRLSIFELGFPDPELQYQLTLTSLGRAAYVDFAWPRFRLAGEADGWDKYSQGRYNTALSAEDRLRQEKRRDNAIRSMSCTPIHWEWTDAWDRTGLRAILLGAGLPIVNRPRVLR
jgi:hypothetical protein